MTTTAASVAQRIVGLLQDPTSIRWTAQELVRYMNDGQREIIKARPDALNITSTMTLAAGTRQDLDSASLEPTPLKLIEITRNLAATSTLKAVRQCQRSILDANLPGWHNMAPSVNVVHFMFDVRDPKTFYVYPPATTAAQLEIMYAAYPTDIIEPETEGAIYSDITGNIGVADIYAVSLVDYVLYRCYTKDASYASNAARASSYMAAFAQGLGIELNATLQISPTIKDGVTVG